MQGFETLVSHRQLGRAQRLAIGREGAVGAFLAGIERQHCSYSELRNS